MNKQGIVKSSNTLFPTEWHSATKFGINQILISIAMSSFCGINRICKIASFTGDGLVRALLKLDKAINENTISSTLKKFGQNGAHKLQRLLLSKNARWLHQSGLESITLDTDSTVKSACGNQQGAAKGFNQAKKGAKSYHPLLVFVSEMKLLYHTWFRTGSAYTTNGIVDFLKEVEANLPENIDNVFFKADSGFFSGKLFDLLESFGWDYLVKVKLKNLAGLFKKQKWEVIDKQNLQSEFCDERDQYKTCFYWRAKKQNLQSETCIEQVKSHAMAGATITADFWANDILWQLFQKLRVEWSLLQLYRDEEIISKLTKRFCLQYFGDDLPAGKQVRQKKDRFKRQEHFTLLNLNFVGQLI